MQISKEKSCWYRVPRAIHVEHNSTGKQGSDNKYTDRILPYFSTRFRLVGGDDSNRFGAKVVIICWGNKDPCTDACVGGF